MHSALFGTLMVLANTPPAGPVLSGQAFLVDGALPAVSADADQRRWVGVSAGDADLCALDTSGRVACWGPGGVDAVSQAPMATDLPVFKEIAVGLREPCRTGDTACVGQGTHACALDADALAWCWGANQHGQLGDGTTIDSPGPTRVRGQRRFQSIRAGRGITCGVSEGEAYCWGSNASGGLGLGQPDTVAHPIPRAIARNVLAIEAAADHVCALTHEGLAYCWGDDYHGRLGSDAANPASVAAPVPVNGVSLFARLSARGNHTCALTRTGSTRCWGSNVDGQLGVDPAAIPATRRPTEPAAPPLDALSAGAGGHTCGVSAHGEAWCWGRNADGELGIPASDTSTMSIVRCYASPCVPSPTHVLTVSRFRSLSAGSAFTCGITDGAQLLCWGRVPWGGPSNVPPSPPPSLETHSLHTRRSP